MKISLIILTFLIVQTTFGQNKILELKSHLEKVVNAEELYNIESVNFEFLSIISIFDELERKIDFGYKHHRILIMSWDGDLKLNLISKNNIIQII